MLLPTAPGTLVKESVAAKIDYSNTNEGYITVSYHSDPMKKCRLRVEHEGGYQHFTIPSDGAAKVFPLCFGDGQYVITVYRQIEDVKYSTLLTFRVDVELSSPVIPWLYPNTYTDYGPHSVSVLTARQVCIGLKDDAKRVNAIRKWIANNIKYDRSLANQIAEGGMSWWLPDPDKVIWEGKCICWGYSSLFAAMCRSQGVPCRICVGRVAGGGLHAWNEVYINEIWMRMDLAFERSEAASQFISDDKNYTVEYYG